MGAFSWLGGRDDRTADEKSAKRAARHRKHATAADRRGWADHDKRDRRLYGE